MTLRFKTIACTVEDHQRPKSETESKRVQETQVNLPKTESNLDRHEEESRSPSSVIEGWGGEIDDFNDDDDNNLNDDLDDVVNDDINDDDNDNHESNQNSDSEGKLS